MILSSLLLLKTSGCPLKALPPYVFVLFLYRSMIREMTSNYLKLFAKIVSLPIWQASVKIDKVEEKLSKGWGGENAYHVSGYRYLLVEGDKNVSRASPPTKVTTLTKVRNCHRTTQYFRFFIVLTRLPQMLLHASLFYS